MESNNVSAFEGFVWFKVFRSGKVDFLAVLVSEAVGVCIEADGGIQWRWSSSVARDCAAWVGKEITFSPGQSYPHMTSVLSVI